MATTAADAITVAEDALEALRKQYADDPGNYELGEEVAIMTNRLIHLKRAGRPHVPFVRPVPEMRAAPDEVWDSLPEFCPSCEGWVEQSGVEQQKQPYRMKGYSTLIGDGRSVRCNLCKTEFGSRDYE